jgi:cytochrome b
VTISDRSQIRSSLNSELKRPDDSRLVRVWDLPTRAIHWALVVLIPFAWWTEETAHLNWHKQRGFVVAALVVFRVFWGFFGSWASRFASFLRGPRAAREYISGGAPEAVSHNPLGGWNVLAMLGLLVTLVILGLFSLDADGYEAGPFASWLTFDQARAATRLHGLFFDALLVLIGLHVVSVLLYLAGGRDLIRPMVTGQKRVSAQIDEPHRASLRVILMGSAMAGGTFLLLWWIDSST